MMLAEKIKEAFYFSGLSIFFQWLSGLVFLAPYYRVLHKTKIEFIGKRPKRNQNYIVVSNHRSMKDPPLLGYAIELPIAFIAKKELFENPLLRVFMSLTSTISVNRDSAELQTFKAAKQALKAKAVGLAWSVGIFIEGTRSVDPEHLGKPNKGPIFIARMAKVPIIPVGISYREGKQIIIKIGEPYEIDYQGDLEEQTWDCLERISKLTDYKLPNR